MAGKSWPVCPHCVTAMSRCYPETSDKQCGFVCDDCGYEEDLRGNIVWEGYEDGVLREPAAVV